MRFLNGCAASPWVALFLFAWIPIFSNAASVITVGGSGMYQYISLAIHEASPEDIIRVAEGIYSEVIEIDKSLTLEGGWSDDFLMRDWDTHITTIDGGPGSTVWIHGDVIVIIEGFTITGGDATTGTTLEWGGGIAVGEPGLPQQGLAIIRNNVITGNCANLGETPPAEGGGIGVRFSTAIIENNTISNNWAVRYSDSPGQGGGIHVYRSDATITDNLISNNAAADIGEGQGGGIYIDAGSGHSVTVANNVIEDNLASVNAFGEGGGVYANSLQTLLGNTIQGNTATSGGGILLAPGAGTQVRDNLITLNEATGTDIITPELEGGGGVFTTANSARLIGNRILENTSAHLGGGILIQSGNHYLIHDNLIEGNHAVDGGGLFVYLVSGGSSVDEAITHNLITGNIADWWGGGMSMWTAATPVLDGNIVVGNHADGVSGIAGAGLILVPEVGTVIRVTNHIIAGNTTAYAPTAETSGGIHCLDGDFEFLNCTIADNEGDGILIDSGGATNLVQNCIIAGQTVGIRLAGSTPADIDFCDLWDNGEDVIASSSPLGPNNVSEDPEFADRSGNDYHLGLTTPLADIGDDLPAMTSDVDGEPRPRGAGIDIGADEVYRSRTYVSASVGSDLTGTGASDEPFATIGMGLGETGAGGEVLVAKGTYDEDLLINRSVDLRGGHDATAWQQSIAENVTALHGTGTGSVVRIEGDGVEALVEGFTITGGDSSANGGGILVRNDALATVRRNTISANRAENAGGGLAVFGSQWGETVVEANRIHGNSADGNAIPPLPGGGVFISRGQVRLVNNFISDNTSAVGGDGLAIYDDAGWGVDVLNNTVVDNGDASGVGIGLLGDTPGVVLRNNLVVGHSIGIVASADVQAVWDHTAFYETSSQYSTGLSAGSGDVTGDPNFFDQAGGDFHILPGSAAMDAGTGAAGVMADIDGESRPMRSGYDIGADECIAVDADTIIDHLLGISPLSGLSLMLCDTNGDDDVDVGDVVTAVNE